MRALRRYILGRIARTRLTAAVALLAYLAASFGLPVPAPAAPKDRSRPYPCMDNPCGCSCAEECWRHCCCMTPEERWAWAEAHNVQPPDYAERPAADDRGNTTSGDAGAEHAGCPHCRRAASQRGSLWGLAVAPLSCRGTTQWVVSGVVPAPDSARPDESSPVAAERLAVADVAPRRLSQAPPLPPPRVSFSV